MTTITKQEAVDRLAAAVKEAGADDLVEIYNELFPSAPTTEDAANRDPKSVVEKIIAHIDNGLEVEEILALWNVIFPKLRKVSFDEDHGMIHYGGKVEAASQAE